MNRTIVLMVMACFALLSWRAVGVGTLFTVATNGPSSNRLNIVILAEGYTAGEAATFTNHARGIVSKFLETEPYSAYTNYFNAYAIFVASNESGSDHPLRNPPVFRDTYFNSTYDSYGIQRLLTIPPNDRNGNFADGRGKAAALLQEWVPDYDIVLILVNDEEYGGSGGSFAVTSVNAASAEIAIHEIGHSYAALGDEYDDPAPGYPDIESANTTRETRREFIKWNEWIAPTTPIPTPETASYKDVVGLFEGAHYQAYGWFRPKLDCKMKTLGRVFCEVCSEALVIEGYQRLSMVDRRVPERSELVTWPGGDIFFEIDALHPVTGELSFQWILNGSEIENASATSFYLSADALTPGDHQLTIQVTDPTLLVRNDPFGDLVEELSWDIEVLGFAPEVTARSVLIEGGSLRLEFESSVTGDLVLETSRNLETWMPTLTNSAATTLVWEVPVNAEEGREFFRLQVKPAR